MKFPMLNHLALVISLILSGQTYALEMLEEEALSDVTGEGIAFLPEDTALLFRGAGTTTNASGLMTDAIGRTTETVAAILDPTTGRNNDTGYIRFIPVGPLTTAATDISINGGTGLPNNIYGATTGKADLFLYGLAISKGNRDYNSRISLTDPTIASWGTATNPWLLKVETASSISNFSSVNCTSATDPLCQVSFLAFEAPLYDIAVPTSNLSGPTTDGLGGDAYNLKLAYWADAFVRDPTQPENMGATGAQFDVGGAGRANRMRLQGVLDGVSLNGSRMQMFQTLGGATTAGAVDGHATDTFYNNTLGLAGVLRLNSGDTQALRAVFSTTGATRTFNPVSGFNGPSTTATTFGSGCGSGSVDFLNGDCQYRFRERTVTDSVTGQTWTPPTNMSVLRLSTQETANTSIIDTPAIGALAGGGSAPVFNATEGMFLYGFNANLVLGSLAQPLIVGKDSASNNLVLEVTSISNKAELYKGIYTDYSGLDASYKGSTCNVIQCGNNGLTGYQGNNATHSSITIGSTVYNSANNTLTAYSGLDSVGVSFGALNARVQGASSVARNDVEFQQRQKRTQSFVFTDRYRLSASGLFGDTVNDPYSSPLGACTYGGGFGGTTCNRWFNATGVYYDWAYLTAINSGVKVFNDTNGTTAISTFEGTPANDGQDADVINGNAGDYANNNNPAAPPFVSGLYDCEGSVAGANCDGSGGGGGSGTYGVGGTVVNPPVANLGWDDPVRTSQIWYKATGSAAGAYNIGTTKTADVIPTAITVGNPSALNNLGSVVIDGLLIQHLKMTTKGL